ncbi:MAG: hypothetical protein M1140_14395 [Chloroflexi bacterium]|nr:hypothetical protein [Chloroflexota bacterium]
MRASTPLVVALGQFITRLADVLRGRAGTVKASQALHAIEPRVLLITFDPWDDAASQVTLTRRRGWADVDALVSGYIADIAECSNGLVQYRVVEQRTVNEFPVLTDGFSYDPQSLLDVLERGRPHHTPEFIDYHKVVADFNLYERIAGDEIDEVWLFGFPWAGFYESRMAGAGAFWCNAPALEQSEGCPRRFVIMGFSYERGVGEMLESFGHRVESTMKQVYSRTKGEDNLWERYIRHARTNPGMSEVGTLHYAPNSDIDYDWGNRRMVLSKAADWLTFPNFTGKTDLVNCSAWGNGAVLHQPDIRAHHKWWLNHLPKVAGSTHGIAHNWWAYAADPNNVIL